MSLHDGQITHVRDYLDPLAMTRLAGAPPPGIDQAGPAPVPSAGHTDLLTRPLFARVATVRSDGAPQNSVMWFAWDGTHLKPAHSRRGQKYRNITADPRVSVSLADPDNPYRSLEIRGTVTSITADAGAAFFTELARRYGYPGGPVPNPEHRVVLSVRPASFATSGPAMEAERPL